MIRLTVACALLALALSRPASARTVAHKQKDLWIIENSHLRVTVAPVPGSIMVRDKLSDYEWRQPGTKEGIAPPRARFRQIGAPPAIDGDLAEWQSEPTVRLAATMNTDVGKVASDQDCSADIWCAWDQEHFYLAARVWDDSLEFGPTGMERWWEKDSLELWVGEHQVGLNLNPDVSQARTIDGALPGSQAVMQPLKDGYTVEAALPWKSFPGAPKPVPGSRFGFAVGANDADASGTRKAQLYFPTTWVHSNSATFAGAALADEKGNLPATPAAPEPKFRRVRRLSGPSGGIAFEADFGSTRGRPNTVTVSLEMPDGSGDLVIEADMPDHSQEMAGFPFLDPFLLDTPRGVLAVADYSNGHLYPLDLKPFPAPAFGGDRLDMPWVGVCDLDKGMGYTLILETSDDAAVLCHPYQVGRGQVVAPQVVWNPSKGRFAYPRRILYRFTSKGSYVALAKAYRAYAKEKGLIVPFAEKLKENPNIRRLFGAPDVWGDATLAFAQQAKAAGVDKMLIHGRSSPQDMKAINALGYLTSEYDNYTDILPVEKGQEPDSTHDLLPDHAVMNPDGQRMAAWLTWDKKTQFMKRCPSFWVPTAKLVIPKVLKTYPFIGRFIDVTTAEGLYECYDSDHPLTKAGKRQCGVDLLSYVRSEKLVVGGEHGIWWGVPYQDYIEGMMSSYQFSWPAGHLIHPKTKEEEFTSPWGGKLGEWSVYEKWGIGHEWRVPLWELVFHDCVVSTWYWGDSSDWLLAAAPEITPKKDAFNILYGTIPLLWAEREGSWQKARDVFLRTYRNTCKLHEVIAGKEMLGHEFLTPDHAVQRTRFSDGTRVVVNFGLKPYTVQLGRKRYLLPQNGFAAKGPRIEQSLALVGGKPVTTIRQKGYLFTDGGGVEITMRSLGSDRIRVHIGSTGKAVVLKPCDVSPGWDLAGTHIFVLDSRSQRVRHLLFQRRGPDALRVGPFPEATTLDVVCRSRARLPDLWLDPAGVALTPSRPRQGEPAKVSVVLHNGGGSAASHVEVAFFADTVQSDHELAARTVSLMPGQKKTITATIDTSSIDGARRILAVADPKDQVAELCRLNNQTSRAIAITPDFSQWPYRRMLRVETGDLERENEVAIFPCHLPDANASSVRVVECDPQGHPGAEVPAQFDPTAGGQGELGFILPGKTPARATRYFLIHWAGAKGHHFLAPPARMWDKATRIIDGESYRVAFHNGTLVDLAAKHNGAPGKPFIATLILSSQETGWTDEPGTVQQFKVLHAGPVRTRIVVRKALNAGVVYEKTYTFYPRRFDLAISLNKPAGGLYSRAYYLQEGEYTDDQGFHARVDGQGDGEEVYGKAKNPRWYAVYANQWAHSCIALSPFSEIAYWDSGSWGGIGFVAGATGDIRMSYAIHPGAPDARFAESDYRRLISPVKVEESL